MEDASTPSHIPAHRDSERAGEALQQNRQTFQMNTSHSSHASTAQIQQTDSSVGSHGAQPLRHAVGPTPAKTVLSTLETTTTLKGQSSSATKVMSDDKFPPALEAIRRVKKVPLRPGSTIYTICPTNPEDTKAALLFEGFCRNNRDLTKGVAGAYGELCKALGTRTFCSDAGLQRR